MILSVDKNEFQNKLSLASRFCSSKTTTSSLQGTLLDIKKEKINFYATNLNSFFHGQMNLVGSNALKIVIEPKKINEFLGFLKPIKIELVVKEKQLIISQNKTKGAFPLMAAEDFPLPPSIKGKPLALKKKDLVELLPLVLFAAAKEETRPVLSGVNLLQKNDELLMVATDGFRLSLIKTGVVGDLPPLLVPSGFLTELMTIIKQEEKTDFFYLAEEKMLAVKAGDDAIFSRLIEGEFPPFEKVILSETKTVVELDKEEFLRNVKLISVFARDASNIIVCEFKKNEASFRPKTTNQEEGLVYQEAELKGEEQKAAFNYKFLLDFLNNVSGQKVTINMLRSDAPVIFKTDKSPRLIHVIMPVRIQEE